MPGAACNKIKDPKERAKCKAYQGKYSKMTPTKIKPAKKGY